jgi:hypothetical protein
MAADWRRIKSEYVTKGTSYRKLSEKYGLSYRSVADKGNAEGWVELRNQYLIKTTSDIVDAVGAQDVDRATKLQTVADKVLNMVEAYIEASDPIEIDTQSMKHISGVLKDIKEVLRSPKDLEEQDARIAKLRKEAEKEEDTNTEVVITFGSGGKKEWAE